MEMDRPVQIPDRMFFKIGEVAEIVGVKPHVLRYWETEFPILAPTKKSTSQQRMYARADVENILLVKDLLYRQRFSIEGAKKQISELRRSGSLAEARKPKLAISLEKAEALESAKQEVRELMEWCQLDH